MRWLAVFVAVAALGCESADSLIDDAKQKQASGELDAALTLLGRVKDKYPGTESETEARSLAEAWLVAVADLEPNPSSARVRLDEALEWNPKSGAAQIRICRMLIHEKKLEEAQECVGHDMEGKTGAPEIIAKQVHAALSKRKNASTGDERKRLLASSSPHHWEALLTRYPDSPEAKEARLKLRGYQSLCADLDRFVEKLETELKRQEKVASRVDDINSREQGPRIDAYEVLAKEAGAKARIVKNAAGDVDAHQLRDGEREVQKTLRTALWAVSDSGASLSEGLERHPLENLDSYASQGRAKLTAWGKSVEKLRERVDELVRDARNDCDARSD